MLTPRQLALSIHHEVTGERIASPTATELRLAEIALTGAILLAQERQTGFHRLKRPRAALELDDGEPVS